METIFNKPLDAQVASNTDAIANLKTPIQVPVTINTTAIGNGSITVYRVGKVVQVFINGLYFNATGASIQVATGLPTAQIQASCIPGGTNAAQTARILGAGNSFWIGTNGTTLLAHCGGLTDQPHWGSIVYITSD